MARNRVQYIVSADSEEAVRAVEKFLLKEKEAGVQSDRLKEQGKGAFDGIGDSVVSLGTKMLGGLGAYEAIQTALDMVRERAVALREEMERTAEANLRHVDSFQTVMQNLSSASEEEVALVEQSLRGIAGGSKLENPLERINEAYATVQSAIPNATPEDKLAIVREAVQSAELEPQANIADVALGIGAIWAGADGALTPNQAQNLMRAQQEQGRIKEVGPLAQMQGTLMGMLGDLERGGSGLSPAEIMGLSAATTQALDDPTGERSRTVLSNVVGKLMVAGEEFKEKTGVELSGNLLDRLTQIHEGLLSGEITPEEMKEARPGIGLEGAQGATFQRNLLQSERGFSAIQTAIDFIGDPRRLQGDSVAESIEKSNRLVPGYKEQQAARGALAALESERAGDVRRTAFDSELKVFEAELMREGTGESMIKTALSAYAYARESGSTEEAARRVARRGMFIPGAGAVYDYAYAAEAIEKQDEGLSPGESLVELVQILRSMSGRWFRDAIEQSMRRGMESALQSQGGRVRPVPDQ